MDDISIIILGILIWVIMFGSIFYFGEKNNVERYKKLYEDLQSENKKLKKKYKNRLPNVDIKSLPEECLRDTSYWIKCSMELTQEVKDLKNQLDDSNELCSYHLDKQIEWEHKFNDIKKEKSKLEKEIVRLDEEITRTNRKLDLIKKDNPNKITELINILVEKEFEEFDNLVIHLDGKDRPAPKAAEEARLATSKIREYEKKYKLMKYEYDLLFELFPELENYIETIDGSTTEEQSLEDVKADYDWSIKWLSEEEYHNLPVDERNQLALDRYIESRKKSKWQIGRDFEMYIGYLYETDGYKVTYTGIEKKLEDMGRDLIAENDKEVLIIQCKYWSKDKVIHEKHICQLYGTAIHYKRTNNIKKNVKPVFVTKTSLSDTAKDFADYLKVKIIENKELEEFPRIKCNIGKGGEKIYHMPFDQQYDRTIIDKIKGECFVSTVEEAVNKGFRRAKKYYG